MAQKFSWLFSSDYVSLQPDTGLWCRGKGTGVFGAFLLAIYNEDAEEYQTISKIGTGFSEEQLKDLADLLRPLAISEPRSYYRYAPAAFPLAIGPGSSNIADVIALPCVCTGVVKSWCALSNPMEAVICPLPLPFASIGKLQTVLPSNRGMLQSVNCTNKLLG